MEVLWDIFKENKGKMPSRKQRSQLAEQLGMKDHQIYKWFWEAIHKYEDSQGDQVEATNFAELSPMQRYEAFINKSMKQCRD